MEPEYLKPKSQQKAEFLRPRLKAGQADPGRGPLLGEFLIKVRKIFMFLF
jgi:hypothetical protein